MPMHFVVRAQISAEITRMAVMRFGQPACQQKKATGPSMRWKVTCKLRVLCLLTVFVPVR